MQVLEALDESRLDELTHQDEFFWLDIAGPTDEQIDALADRFGWHKLVREDLKEFEQRPKIDNYGDYMLLVFYGAHFGADGDPALTEVHIIVSGSYIVTLRHKGCDELEHLHARFQQRPAGSEQFVVYRVLDTLTDSFFPVLERLDETIDQLEDDIVQHPTDEQLQRIFRTKRLLVTLRRVVTPQRDLAARAIEDIKDLPGLDPDQTNYFRDIYDHLIRVSDTIDSYRDLVSGAMDAYLSTVSNRMNVVMKQLTIIATIFLPLTFLTGFFGQNFGWLVKNISSFWVFLVFGLGSLAVSCAILLWYFRRAGFMSSDG
ncbi:MAG: magnesium and cobalt transport protein CorA [Solirubrobacterales bacterium]|jgi:magnesium transporter|nr:magnesium and cobalt transport protein CorA [Solirubrobacterales bacterium]